MKEKNSNTVLNDRLKVEIFLHVRRFSCTVIEYRMSAGREGELKSLKAQEVLLVESEGNFNRKRRAIKLARSPCSIVQSCKQDHNTSLCLYRANQDNGCEVNEASSLRIRLSQGEGKGGEPDTNLYREPFRPLVVRDA